MIDKIAKNLYIEKRAGLGSLTGKGLRLMGDLTGFTPIRDYKRQQAITKSDKTDIERLLEAKKREDEARAKFLFNFFPSMLLRKPKQQPVMYTF